MVVRPYAGDDYDLTYDVIVVTAGAVTRTFPVAGLMQAAIGLKHVEEAVAIRNRLLASSTRLLDCRSGVNVGASSQRSLWVVALPVSKGLVNYSRLQHRHRALSRIETGGPRFSTGGSS